LLLFLLGFGFLLLLFSLICFPSLTSFHLSFNSLLNRHQQPKTFYSVLLLLMGTTVSSMSCISLIDSNRDLESQLSVVELESSPSVLFFSTQSLLSFCFLLLHLLLILFKLLIPSLLPGIVIFLSIICLLYCLLTVYAVHSNERIRLGISALKQLKYSYQTA